MTYLQYTTAEQIISAHVNAKQYEINIETRE
jgi:hypothetical protein